MRRIQIGLVLIGLAMPSMAVQQQPSGQRGTAKSEGNANQAVPLAAHNKATNYYQQDAADKPKGWHKLIAWPEGITAWLIMLTLFAIVWQAVETRKAAEAAQKGADAAFLNAKAIIDAERAWIAVKPGVISPEFFPLREGAPIVDNLADVIPRAHQFPATLINHGQTPARIEAVAIHYIRTPHHPSAWKPEPDYGQLVKSNTLVFPKDEEVSAIVAILTPDSTMTALQIEEVRNAKQFLFAYGVVQYSDVYGKLHETRFAYVYKAQERHLILKGGKVEEIRTGQALFETMGIPSAYNQAD